LINITLLSNRLGLLSIGLVISLAAALIIPNSSILIPKEKSIAQNVKNELNTLETAVSSTLLDRQFFKNMLDVVQNNAPVTNDIVEKMNAYSSLPFTIYVYSLDSLLYWSKPGLIIDPAFFKTSRPPFIASDHLKDFLIKEYTIYHDFTNYTVYAKIPVLSDHIDRNRIRLVSTTEAIQNTEEWQRITSVEGEVLCAIVFAKEKLGFWQQLGLLVTSLVCFILFALWLPRTIEHFAPKLVGKGRHLWLIGTIISLRLVLLLVNYHSTFDELYLLTPVNSNPAIPYSLADLMLDSVLFTTITLLWARIPPAPVRQTATILERYTISIGSYLLMILSVGLFAWIQRWLILETTLPLNLDHISFAGSNNAAVFTSLACVIFGLFVLGQRLLHDLPQIQPSIYRRIGDLIIAGLISLVFTTMLDLSVPLFGFYIAVLSSLVLFDLYTESNQRSVIWVICWTMLVAGFEAGLLHNYHSDKDIHARFTLAQQLSVDLTDDSGGEIDDIVLNWLPNIPSRNSLGVFKDNKLAYSYNYAYPLLLPDSIRSDKIYDIGDNIRSEVGYQNGAYSVLIGKRNSGLMQVISLFSYTFALFNIFLFFVALSNSFFHYLPKAVNLSFSSRPTLRNRIQVAIVFLIILSFVIIGFVTVFYLRNTSEDRDKKYFEQRLRAIATSIAQTVPLEDSLAGAKDLVSKIAGIAYVYNRQAKIYNVNGDLVLQSDSQSPAPLKSAIKMSFVNKFEMDQSDLTYSIQTTQSSQGTFYQGLLSLRDDTGRKYAYIELPGISMTQADPETGSRFFGTLLNAYVFLFLIAVALAIGVANSITRPLAQLGEKLKQLKLGKKNEEILWGIDDEIGGLINDYNLMIQKLDESAQLLALTERDTAWREMARQVAHEIKNPLTPMKLSIQYLQKSAKDSDDIHELVKRVSNTLIEQIDNLSRIASEFSNFATMPQAQNETVVLNDVVASVHDLFRKREDMNVQLYVPIQDIIVFADRNQMLRVLNNVIKNAIQAIPDDKRGKINISLLKKGDAAVISVEDNGVGITEEMREKVFRPNFTTKSSGTGLGLAICANIMDTFNGRIYFETEEGKGTKFYIEIPLMKFDDNIKEQERVIL
jgi:signal transduction histidine kinase